MSCASLHGPLEGVAALGGQGYTPAVLATGVDVVELDRVRAVVERWGDRFLRRIYTPGELRYCRGRIPQLAARFAAKEAIMKALGTGRRGVGWKDIEVVRQRGQPPTVRLSGRGLARARYLGIREMSLSISHSREYAVAFVVAIRGDVP